MHLNQVNKINFALVIQALLSFYFYPVFGISSINHCMPCLDFEMLDHSDIVVAPLESTH